MPPISPPIPDAKSKSRKSGVVVPHKAKWHQRLAATLVYLSIRALAATIRFRLDDRAGFFNGAPRGKIIFAVWHNRLALSVILYRRFVLKFAPERRMAGMVSATRRHHRLFKDVRALTELTSEARAKAKPAHWLERLSAKMAQGAAMTSTRD